MRSTLTLTTVVSLMLLAFAVGSLAQTITGTISGDVLDTTGAAVVNATVTVTNTGTNDQRTAATTNTGSYRVPDLAIGKYKISVTAPGFKTSVQNAEVATGASPMPISNCRSASGRTPSRSKAPLH